MHPARDGPGRVRFGVFELDLRTGELRKRGLRIRLQEQPFQVLAMLLERPRELVTREELRQRLWTADTFVDFDHGLNKAINKIRGALGDSAASPRFIETVARRCYRFIADVASVETSTLLRRRTVPLTPADRGRPVVAEKTAVSVATPDPLTPADRGHLCGWPRTTQRDPRACTRPPRVDDIRRRPSLLAVGHSRGLDHACQRRWAHDGSVPGRAPPR